MLLRLWFGGAELYAYAVDKYGQATQIDKMQVDLKRYGVPKIDQHKIPIPPAKGPEEPRPHEASMNQAPGKAADSTAASHRILSKPPPDKNTPPKKTPTKKTAPKKTLRKPPPAGNRGAQ